MKNWLVRAFCVGLISVSLLFSYDFWFGMGDLRTKARSLLQEYYPNALVFLRWKILGVDSEEVVIGRNGQLFLQLEGRLNNGTASNIRARIQLIDHVAKKLQRRHADVYVFFIPDKSHVLSAFAPEPFLSRENIKRKFVEAALADVSFRYFPADELAENLENAESLWFQTDSHWNHAGAMFFARALARYIFPTLDQSKQSFIDTDDCSPHFGDLLTLAGGVNFGDSVWARLVSHHDRTCRFQLIPQTPESLTDMGTGPEKVVILGSSFSARTSFSVFFEHLTGQTVLNLSQGGKTLSYVLKKFIVDDPIDTEGRILIFETPERLLEAPFDTDDLALKAWAESDP